MAVKSRTIAGLAVGGYPAIGGGTETIETFGHNLRDLGSGDVGGPMHLTRSVIYPYRIVYHYNGEEVPFEYTFIWPTDGISPKSDSDMRASGTTAIARTAPVNPLFSASNALGELLHDGAPSVVGVQTWRERTKIARSAGSEYLNYQFGWVPLVNDVRNFAHTVRNHHRVLQEFQAGSGKVTRVGYNFPSVVSTTSGSGQTMIRRAGSWGWTSTVPARWVQQSVSRTWFKGAFTYHLPVGQSAAAKAARFASYADHLYGVALTPEVLWNLAPWTWALDWFSNAGDVITNVSNIGKDGLVLRYGYVMHHTSRTTQVESDGRWFGGFYDNRIDPASATMLEEQKKRLPANPYSGFSVNLEPLSAVQSAILLALGLSRSHV